MRRTLTLLSLLFTVILAGKGQDIMTTYTPTERYYGTGSWDSDSLGNHRVVLRVNGTADVVTARIPWRRRDHHPETKHIYIVDGSTNRIVTQYRWSVINREYGEVEFAPPTSPGTYYIHYLLYRHRGSRNYPKGYYLPFEAGDERFLSEGNATRAAAELVRFEAIDSFNTFFPMEVIATRAETDDLAKQFPSLQYLLFPEDRSNAISMTKDLPAKWIADGPRNDFRGTADRGEFYSFQAGLYAMRQAISDLAVGFSDLRSSTGDVIPASAFSCFNTGGVDWEGKRFTKTVSVPKGQVQALWMGVQVPTDARPGIYTATVTVWPKALPS